MVDGDHPDAGIEAHLQRIGDALVDLRSSYPIDFIVSISGAASEHSAVFAHAAISQIMEGLRRLPCAVLTGGTAGGVPEFATRTAKAVGLPTIAVFPSRAKKHVLFDQIDLPIETLPPSVGKATFGTETPTFAQLPDYAVVIGGSYGTLAEVSTILKINAKRDKDGVRTIDICPLTGSGGVADLIHTLVRLEPSLLSCLPSTDLISGDAIAEYIRMRNMRG